MQKIGHRKVKLMTMSCGHVMPSWSIMSRWSSGQVLRNDGTSVAGLERLMGLLIALVWLMVHCFLWLLHPRWMVRIIIQEKVIMLLKVWSFVMMLIGLHGSKWGGRVAFMTIEYVRTVRYIWVGISILIRRSICFKDSVFSTSAVTVPAFKKGHNSSLSE